MRPPCAHPSDLLPVQPFPLRAGSASPLGVSDLIGLHAAFQLVPLVSIAAAAVFFYAKCHYHNDIARLKGVRVEGRQGNDVMLEVKS